MKKIFLLLAYFLMVSNSIFSQSGWFWQNPLPTGNDLEEIKFYDVNTGYAVGWGSTIIKTTNSGITWQIKNSGVEELINYGSGAQILTEIDILDVNTIIVAGNGFIKSTDGGNSWFLLTSSLNFIEDMDFINEQTGFAVSYNNIYKTTNGGLNWISNNLTGYWKCIKFYNSSTGLIGSNQGAIHLTTNMGFNWISMSNGINSSIYSIDIINNNVFFAAGNRKIYKSTNSGNNWNTILQTTGTSGGVISFSNLDTGYFCTWNGKIFITKNSGVTWDSTQLCGLTTSLFSSNSNCCLVVGTRGTIHRTDNAGINWYNSSSFINCPRDFKVIYFPDSYTGYLFGTNGMIYKTTNTGVNWVSRNFSNSNYLSAQFLNKDTGFAGSYRGIIFYTSNGGNTWDTSRHVNDSIMQINSIYFQNFYTGYVSGYLSVYKTTNNGFNWARVLNNSYTNSHLQRINGVLYCAGNWQGMAGARALRIYKSTDNAQTWSTIYYWENNWVDDFKMTDSLTGYMVYNSNYANYGIIKSTNGGYNWFNTLTSNHKGESICFVDNSTGYFSNGYKTTNGGLNWYRQKTGYYEGYSYNLKDIYFVNNSSGLIIGDGGMIIKTTDGGGTLYPIGINNEITEAITRFSLSQNYPNPFNPQTKIKFDIPANANGQSSNVKLVVYDLLGREVATLMNEELKPGTYEADWDASNFSSGVYFYKIIAGDPSTGSGHVYTETKKMVLIK